MQNSAARPHEENVCILDDGNHSALKQPEKGGILRGESRPFGIEPPFQGNIRGGGVDLQLYSKHSAS